MPDKDEIVWSVETHEHKERSVDWYWGLGACTLAGAGVSLFLGNGLLSIILIIGALSVALLVARGPREHSVKLGTRGVTVDGTFYRWNAVRSFWVEHEVPRPHLFFNMNGIVPLTFSFPIESETKSNEIRMFLRKFAHEEEQGPHLGERIAALFGL